VGTTDLPERTALHPPPALETQSDAHLVVQLLAAPTGSVLAQALAHELCRRFAPRIRLFGLRHLRDGDAAEDLVQEVLLIFLETVRAGTLRDPAQTPSFILGTCRNVVWNRRRGDQRRRRILERYGWQLLPDAEEAPEPVDVGALTKCLARLSERERHLLYFSFDEELPARAIAERLRVTETHVRVLRHRALGQLRDCLALGRTDGR
jgi:RNA polymerase sigma-70 factor, ECF subfamily